MAQQDASDDNSHADSRNKDNTPETAQRNDNSEAETTSAMETEKNDMKGNAQPPREEDRTRETKYTKNAEWADITKLVAIHPEMPGEIELNRESRKQLSELMLEYPTKTRDLEEEEAEETEQRRNYTCINCKKSFRTAIGGTNHLRDTPECRKVHQKENLRINAQTLTEPSENRMNYENIGNMYVQDRKK